MVPEPLSHSVLYMYTGFLEWWVIYKLGLTPNLIPSPKLTKSPQSCSWCSGSKYQVWMGLYCAVLNTFGHMALQHMAFEHMRSEHIQSLNTFEHMVLEHLWTHGFWTHAVLEHMRPLNTWPLNTFQTHGFWTHAVFVTLLIHTSSLWTPFGAHVAFVTPLALCLINIFAFASDCLAFNSL